MISVQTLYFDVDKYAGDHMLWGWFAPYPFLIFLGAMAAIIACVVKFRLKRMPIADLQITIVIVLPVGLLCASLFGKLGTSATFNWKIYEYFFIWEPGMNLYGGLAGGFAVGFAYLWSKHNKRMISMWTYADAIMPNLLIAQAVGRWGNLFNHEILGKVVDQSAINWLPSWIWERCYYIYNPATGEKMTEVVFREPLFLYESIATLILFILLSFVIPNLGRWFSKKPWKYNHRAYPCTYNKEYRWANESEVDFFPLQAPLKYRYNKEGQVSYSLNSVWKKAYYWRDVDVTASRAAQDKIDKWRDKWDRFVESKNNLQKRFKVDKIKLKRRFKNDRVKLKTSMIELKSKYREDVQELQRPSRNALTHWWKFDSKELYQLHNDNKYFIIHSGFVSAVYLILYTFVRIILETRRSEYELSIKSSWVLDGLMYFAIFAIGVALLIFSQFIAPKKWREEGWLYEKSY
jgi:phosphatidylglycerol:prolipoprotein diacylglycerol transferase